MGRWPQTGPQPQRWPQTDPLLLPLPLRWRRKGLQRLLLQLARHPRWLLPKLVLCPTLQRQGRCPIVLLQAPRSLLLAQCPKPLRPVQLALSPMLQQRVRLALSPRPRQQARLQSRQSRRRCPSRRRLPAVLWLWLVQRLQWPPIRLLLHLPLGRLPTRPPPRHLALRLAQQQ